MRKDYDPVPRNELFYDRHVVKIGILSVGEQAASSMPTSPSKRQIGRKEIGATESFNRLHGVSEQVEAIKFHQPGM